MKRNSIFVFITAALCLLTATVIVYYLKGCSSPGSITATSNYSSSSSSSLSGRDGTGTAVLLPDKNVSASSINTWTIVYTAAEPGILPGGGVAFHIPPFWGWTPPQLHSRNKPGYVTVSCSEPVIEIDTDCNPDLFYVCARIRGKKLLPGTTITLVYGDTAGGHNPGAQARADRYAEDRERFYIKVDGDGDGYFAPIAKQPSLCILPRPPERIIVSAPSHVLQGSPFTVSAAAVDRTDNWVRSFDGRIELTANSAAYTLKPKETNISGVSFFECVCTKETSLQFTATAENGALSGTSNPVLCMNRLPRRRLFWADLHGHSNLSDGTGTPEDYFLYARYVSGLDAAALTDHDAYGFDLLDEHREIWNSIKHTTNQMNSPGRFITLPGYEWTNWNFGHKHVLFLNGPAPLYSSRDPRYDTPEKLWAALKPHRALTVSHHVGGGPVPADWNVYNPNIEPVVEICSIHGNSEYFGCPLSIYRPRRGCFVQDALARGHRLGIIGGGDTHNGHPGQGDPLAPIHGLTAFFAEKLTREALWNALKSRHTYATTGSRIILRVQIDEAMMGDVLPCNETRGKTLDIRADADTAISNICLIKNNTAYKTFHPGTAYFSRSVVLPEDLTKGDFIYVRVTLENTHMAWSSPIWFR